MFTIIKTSFHNLQQSFFKRSELSPTDKKIAKLNKKISMLRASNETMHKHRTLYQNTVTSLNSPKKNESIFQKDRRQEWKTTVLAKVPALSRKITINRQEIAALEKEIARMKNQRSTAQIARPSQPPLKSISKKEIQAGNRPPQNNQKKYGKNGTSSDQKTPKKVGVHEETLELSTQKSQRRRVKKTPPKPAAALFSTRPARPVGAQARAFFA